MKHPETPNPLLVHLPADNVLAFVDPVLGRLEQRGLLPRRRPPAAVVKTIPAVAAPAGNRQLTNVPNRLMGFALRETTGTAGATVELRDGTDATGDLVVAVTLAAGESTRDHFGEGGLGLGTGLYLVRVAGSVDGSVWFGEV